MNNRAAQCGLSLAEALITLSLMCIFFVPAVNMLRQSAVNYRRAYIAYQMDLHLSSLLLEAKIAVGTNSFADVITGFSKYADDEGFECIILVEDRTGQSSAFKYPVGSDLAIRPASVSNMGYFAGLITAAIKDTATGVVKIRALPF